LPEAQALANQVAKLQQAGARYIIVSNEYQPPSASQAARTYGQVISNATFADLAAAGVKFIFADTSAVIAAVEQNPLAFGITAPITSNACMFTGLSSLAASGVFCANTTTPSPANVTGEYGWLVTPDATRTHLFAGGTHLSEAGQIIIANYYDSLLTQQWNGTEIANRPVNGGAARLS
jgi:outer membrane lipase/esterase